MRDEKPKFVPIPGEYLVVDLPSERIRCAVIQVPDDDTAIVEIVTAPFGKLHRYRKGDLVPVRRKQTSLEEVWEAVDERQLALAQSMKKFEEEQAAKEAAALEEVSDAPDPGKRLEDDLGEREGDGARGVSAETGGGGKPGERPAKPKGQRRSRD